jgi:two-component system copper resistance phosphate regulon response regulator CusR
LVSKVQVFNEVWDLNADMDSSKVEVYISMLRNNVDKGYDKKLIHTVVGMGYIMKEE